MTAFHEREPFDPTVDPPLVPPAGHKSASILERVLRRGEFAVTAELNPPDSADPRDVFKAAEPLWDVADAINATDASGANCHMSSMGICSILARYGIGSVLQIACRDRNRIAIQGDVLGAAATGVGSILCLTGDGVGVGDQPGARPVFDFDALSLLRTLRTMRDEGAFLSGRKLSTPPQMRPAPTSSRPTIYSISRCSAASWNGCATWGWMKRSSSWPASGPWPRRNPPAGCAKTCPASMSPTKSSNAWNAPKNPARRARNSA
jgi:hypothetical protein